MENWQENVGTGHTHEPHEVTIQLDGLGRKLRDLPVEPIAVQESAEGPVFVDESGRRSKKFRRIGWVLAAVCACYAITLVAAVLGGNSDAPLMPGLGESGDGKRDHVEIQPGPSDGVTSVPTPHAPPGTPAASDPAGLGLPLPSLSPAVRTPRPDAPQTSTEAPAVRESPNGGVVGDPTTGPEAPGSSAPAPGPGTPVGGETSQPAPSGSPAASVQEGAQ